MGIHMMNTFNVVLNDQPFTQKPSGQETAYHVRRHFRNRVVRLSIFELAKWINAGHSFYANVLDYRLNTKPDKENPDQLSPYLNGTCYVPHHTSLISVDVDHGHMTLEELKACMASVPHALIYKTFSYDEEKHRKYRVLFIANRCFKDEAEFKLVQSSLIYLFAHPFKDRLDTLEKGVDFSIRDAARISFAGQVIEHEIHDRTFDLDLFISQCQQLKTLELIETYLANWRIEKKRRKALEKGEAFDENSAQTRLNKPERAKTDEERQDDLQRLIHGLERLKEVVDLPLIINFNDTIKFVYDLPLHEILSEAIGLPFLCYLPDHHDEDPSAVILLNEAGQTRYFCHVCGNGHSYSNFDFIEQFLQDTFGYDRFQVIQFLSETLGIKVTSEYRNEALMRLQLIRDFLNEWSEEDELRKLLIRRNLFTTYETLINLASTKVGLQPTTLDKTNVNPTFFMSSSHLYYQLVEVRKYRQGLSNSRKVREKITELAYLGLIKKIDDDRLDEAFLKRSESYRQLLIQKEFETEGKTRNNMRRMDYYEIPMLSARLIQGVLTLIETDKSLGVKVKGRKAKQILHTHGEEKVKEVMPQGEFEDSRLEKRFISALEKAVEVCLDKQGYFTEKQLVAKIDPKQKIPLAVKEKGLNGQLTTLKSASARKKELLPVYLPEVVKKKELTKDRVNKETRQRFNIPASINSSTHIYYKK